MVLKNNLILKSRLTHMLGSGDSGGHGAWKIRALSLNFEFKSSVFTVA